MVEGTLGDSLENDVGTQEVPLASHGLCRWRSFSASCHDDDPMNTRAESGRTNLVAIGVLVGGMGLVCLAGIAG